MNRYIVLIVSSLLMYSTAFAQTLPKNKNWELKWEDDFSALDEEKWLIKDRKSEHNNHTFFLKENVYISDGNLVIKISNDTITHNGAFYNYTTGKLETITPSSYDAQYGYFEARMKIPFKKGLCCAFWTWRYEQHPFYNAAEIDIVETFGGKHDNPHTFETNVHKKYPDGNKYKKIHKIRNFNYNDWHTYAIEWNEKKIIWYLDGKAIRTLRRHKIVDPVRVIFSILIESDYLPSTTDSWTEYMYVDYVRVYQLKNE